MQAMPRGGDEGTGGHPSYIEPSIDDLEIDAQVYLPGCYISRAASPSR